MLKDFLDQHCMITNREAESQNAGADEEPSFSAFDFLYLPIDFVYVTKIHIPQVILFNDFTLFHIYCIIFLALLCCLFHVFMRVMLPCSPWFSTESNKGYAFVNFTNPGAARKFFDVLHDQHWDCFQSNKIREIYCAKLQVYISANLTM